MSVFVFFFIKVQAKKNKPKKKQAKSLIKNKPKNRSNSISYYEYYNPQVFSFFVSVLITLRKMLSSNFFTLTFWIFPFLIFFWLFTWGLKLSLITFLIKLKLFLFNCYYIFDVLICTKKFLIKSLFPLSKSIQKCKIKFVLMVKKFKSITWAKLSLLN